MIRAFEKRAGFALPTILIASMVMLIILVTAVSATTSVRSGLDEQYYAQLGREAAESGLARANGCLQDNAYIPQWSGNELHPNTTCTGGAACTNSAACFVLQRPNIRTTFTVGTPDDTAVAQLVRAEGKVELLRTSNGEVWRTYTYSSSARFGVDLSLNTVAFGYADGYGAYFATIAADGRVRGVGHNTIGELGNGTYSNTLIPTLFKLPAGERAVSMFTNFVSGGFNMFALTNSGKVYGSGLNTSGQLGNGTTTTTNQPVQYGLPAGVDGRSVTINGTATYVLGSDNNIYATGACTAGQLGYNYTIAGCTNRLTYTRVNLPTPISGNLNTIPTSNIVTDAHSTYVRMQGGRVYGWGDNGNGQLVNNSTVDSSNPIQIGTYGNTGQPKATQVAFDGVSVYIVDDTGDVKTGGFNPFGQLGGENITIYNNGAGRCLDNKNQDGITVWAYGCNGSVAQEWTFRSDGSIYHPAKNRCLNNPNLDGITVQISTCNGSVSQQFVLRDDRTIYFPNKNKCLNSPNADGSIIRWDACTTASLQQYILLDTSHLVRFGLPASAGNIVKVATDQWFVSVLTDTNQVWSAGLNNGGQLGNGAVNTYQPYPVKFILPGGVTAQDVYVSAYQPLTTPPDYSNVFVIGSDKKVYGAGSNNFGQLGDGTTTDRSTPVAMLGINGTTVQAKEVVSGYGTTVVLTEDGKIYTVGNNASGQLGDGTTTNSSIPKANRYTNILPVTSF